MHLPQKRENTELYVSNWTWNILAIKQINLKNFSTKKNDINFVEYTFIFSIKIALKSTIKHEFKKKKVNQFSIRNNNFD